jgi:streptogramin lyase
MVEIRATIGTTGAAPYAVAVNPAGTRLYVSHGVATRLRFERVSLEVESHHGLTARQAPGVENQELRR